MRTDLTIRLVRLADAVPDVRPEPRHHLLTSVLPSEGDWLASILTWLAKEVTIYSVCEGWSIEWGTANGTGRAEGNTYLEAALSAAEDVAGIQQQETKP